MLLTVFSVVALVIAAVGIYGVMAYNVVQRTGEFGIRMALGAQQRDVLRLVLTQGGKLIGLGLLIGLLATLAASRAMGSMLFNTSALRSIYAGHHHAGSRNRGPCRLLFPRQSRHESEPHRGVTDGIGK